MPLPALDESVDRLFIKSFLLWLHLVCPLQTQASYLSLLVLPPRRDRDTSGVDLMASQTDFQFLTTKTFVWFAVFLWCHPGWSRIIFQNVSQARTTRGSIRLMHACELSWAAETVSYKGTETIKMSLLSVTTPVSVRGKKVVEDWLAKKKWFFSSSYLGQSFQVIPTDSTERNCFARCPNPRVGREKSSKTMQLAKKGKFITDSNQGSCRASNTVVWGQRALSRGSYPNL